ncbi:MAG TPA: Ig-like domain-containing protein [Herpetosiphonaceae bacterium]|nr:Ig-like domain-containing protein [Herpetosiphonaceae bacterium]
MPRIDQPRRAARSRHRWRLLILLSLLLQHLPLLASHSPPAAAQVAQAPVAIDFPCEAPNSLLLPLVIAGGNAQPGSGQLLPRCELTLARNTSKAVEIASLPGAANPGALSLLTPPAHGAASWANGTLIYTPTADYTGLDSVRYGMAGAPPSVVGEVRFWVQPPILSASPTAPPPSLTVPSASVALLVAKTPLGPGDQKVQARLQAAGFAVTVKDYGSVLASDASGKAVILISSSVRSSAMNASFRDTAVPLVTWDHGLYDDLALTGATSGPDYGLSMPRAALRISAPRHPIALGAGLSGSVAALASPGRMAYGAPSPAATRVAALPWAASSPLFAYETGAAMVGRNAPARRAGFFFSDDSPANASAAGWRLFDETVYWAINLNHPPTAGAGTLSTYRSTPVKLNLATLASDADGDPLTYGLGMAPQHGAASLVGSTLTYTPTGPYAGPDQLTYTVSDGRGGTDSASVAISVMAFGAPQITLDASQIPDLPLTIAITYSAVTPENGNLLIIIDYGDLTSFTASQPGSGTGTVTKTYALAGTYTLVLRVTNAFGETATTTRVITVNGPPSAALPANPSLSPPLRRR